jgi:HSP20 family protein
MPFRHKAVRPFFGFDRELRSWPFPLARWPFVTDGETAWEPTVDIAQTDDTVVVKADLPGMKKEEVKVSIDDDSIVISGERKTESETRKKDYFMSEREYGSFYRRLALPTVVDPSSASAKMEDGVLTVTARRTEPRPQAAEVAIQ